MLVFAKARLVMLSVPKTGTTAWEAALAPHAQMVISDPPELKHAPVYRYNRFLRPMIEKFIAPDMEIIAVMREPESWLGSWYRFRQRDFLDGRPNSTRDLSFDAFVQAWCQDKRPGFANVGSQAKFLEARGNGTAVTRLFRHDDQPGLRAFLQARLGLSVEVGQKNVSPKAPLELSAQTRGQLRQVGAADFTLYEAIETGGSAPVGVAAG